MIKKFEVGDYVKINKFEGKYVIVGHGYGDGVDYVYQCRKVGDPYGGENDQYCMGFDMEYIGDVLDDFDKCVDMVNHPPHYNNGNVECIDAIESATVNKKGIEAVCVANVIKYLWRYETKNGIEDVKKAKWYIDKLLTKLESEGE